MKLNNINIILADDDPDDRMLFNDAINDIAIATNLSMYPNGQELMDYLLSDDVILPEIIFLDLNMPIKDGMECLKEIRKTKGLEHLCVAIYSTSSSEEDIENTFVNGANIYINKPNSYKKLKVALKRVLQMNWQYHTSSLNMNNFLLRL